MYLFILLASSSSDDESLHEVSQSRCLSTKTVQEDVMQRQTSCVFPLLSIRPTESCSESGEEQEEVKKETPTVEQAQRPTNFTERVPTPYRQEEVPLEPHAVGLCWGTEFLQRFWRWEKRNMVVMITAIAVVVHLVSQSFSEFRQS